VPWNQFFILQELDSQIDQLREELQLASLLNDDRTAHLDPQIARCRQQVESLEERLRRRQEQRAEAAARIAPEPLAYYETLRQRLKVRPWVVAFSGSSCPACNVILPSKLVGDSARATRPVACPSCHRLLIRRVVGAQPIEGEKASE
jgi:predicted  nucleic acid-binding Zn-ribbon protein